MEKLKSLLPGHSNDKAEADSKPSQPSGKLTGEASHLDSANMPGAWTDDSAPGYQATKGTGISSNPSTVPHAGDTSRISSNEATRGTGISSSIDDQTYSSSTGSRTTPHAGSNPDALAAASSALGATSATGATSGSNLTSASHADPTSSLSSTTGATPGTTTSHHTTRTAGNIHTPIADSFTGTQKSAETGYVGGSAPGVAGQSHTRDAPFSTSSADTGVAGATAGGLTGQSLTNRSYAGDFTAAPGDGTPANIAGIEGTSGASNTTSSLSSGTKVSKPFASDPVSTEPLSGSSTSALGSRGLASGSLASQNTSHYAGDSASYSASSGVTGSGVGSATSGAYTGGSAPGVSGQSATSSAPAITSQSDRGITGAGAATGAAAGVLGAGGATAAYETSQRHDTALGSANTTSQSGNNTSAVGSSGSGRSDVGVDKSASGAGYGDQYNHLSDGTPSGIAVSDPARGGTADRTTGTSSTAQGTSNTGQDSSHHYGRDAAAAVGIGATAGGVGAHELSKDHSATAGTAATSDQSYNVSSSRAYLGSGGPEITTTSSSRPTDIGGTTAGYTQAPLSSTSQTNTGTGESHFGRDAAIAGGAGAGAAGVYEATKQHSTSNTGPSSVSRSTGLGSGAAGTSGSTTAGSGGHGDQYNRLSDGTPSGIAVADSVLPTSGSTGSTSQQNTSGQHHYGRDAALGGAAATAAAGTGAALSNTSADRSTATTSPGYGDQYDRLSDGTPSGIATAGSVLPTSGTTGDVSKQSTSGQHHLGRDAALGGAAGTAAAGAGTVLSGTSANQPSATSTSGHGDQYNRLSDGTPSGIATSDAAHRSIGGSQVGGTGSGIGSGIGSDTQRSATSQHHLGRDAAIGGAGVVGAGTVAYGLSEREKETANIPGTTNTADTSGTGATTKPSAVATGSHHHAHRGTQDEPDSPTGTGETKKKRGLLDKILHRDDPNKLHKEPKDSRKSFEAEGAEVPRTTHDAYGTSAEGGTGTHIGTDGEIGRAGQAISGYGHQDARQALPLSEAERLEQQGATGLGGTGPK